MADLLVRAGALQSAECGAGGKAAGGLTVYFKYCGGEKTAVEDFSPDATCADLYEFARTLASVAVMRFDGGCIPDDSTPIADTGISQEYCIHLDTQLTYLGTAAWHQEGTEQSQEEQDELMNRVCREQFGEGARAATFVEYSRKMISGVPTSARGCGDTPGGHCCFTGPEGYGDDYSVCNPKKCTDDYAPFDGGYRFEHAFSGPRLCIAVR
eukprot:TRINITY_DN1189_c0_g1_i10.p1 TRINITY_DN1189_c0_g1~~TRINITY_DN1189_c0_g1_i10.p1  ORF type:complete len:231 (+),score=25.74 TRINITY_DN1189_c0_g1_i10:62-694(+)